MFFKSRISVCLLVVVYLTAGVNSIRNSKWTKIASCPDNSFVDRISLIFKNPEAEGTRNFDKSYSFGSMLRAYAQTNVVFGLNISCISVLDGERFYLEEIPGSKANPQSKFSSTLNRSSARDLVCPQLNNSRQFGMGVGIEKRFQKHTGVKLLTDASLYCNYKTEAIRVDSNRSMESLWKKVDFCPWGEYFCGIRLKYDTTGFEILNAKFSCCPLLQPTFGWANYRGATKGEIIQSLPQNSQQMNSISDPHYQKELDDPYYINWKFCQMETYVTGIQGQLEKGQFRLSCSDISKHPSSKQHYIQVGDSIWEVQDEPSKQNYIQMEAETSIWEMEDELSNHIDCDGVAIGFQVLYEETTDQIQGIRILCSPLTDITTEDSLPYLKVILPKANTSDKSYSWGSPKMCKINQALCGFKTKAETYEDGNPLGTEHIKAKCCTVPQAAEICSPEDDYELVVECDARWSMTAMTCKYTLTEGVSAGEFPTQAEERGESVRRSVNMEWNFDRFEDFHDSEEDVLGSSKGYYSIAEETETSNQTECMEPSAELEEDTVSFSNDGLKANFLKAFASMKSNRESNPPLHGTNNVDRNHQITAFSTGFDWTRASGGSWLEETFQQISFTLPARLRTRIYQVVGYCANFQVRINNLRRIDERLAENEKLIETFLGL